MLSISVAISWLLSRILIFLIRCYQWTLSPLIGRQCRYQPTCSNYFIQAVEKYGAYQGAYKGLVRIARCHPWGGSGHDPP
ncbi:membrane protein insertion efficiency factor YidD [uncultured Rubinisphaera sp.]|uniref:membrane protein insertion efficiency factor YidD n=1 Tax=uncultured Rubinisphaera sp. TaxID=1678686 RepID=UPI0030DBBA0E